MTGKEETNTGDIRTENHEEDQDDTPGFAMSLVALCVGSFTNGYLTISVFPYAGFLVMHTIPSTTEESVGTLAGFLASSFMVGRTLTAYSWGRASDRYGRKFVLTLTLVLSAVCSLGFGMATTFRSAMLWRFWQGVSNAILGSTKTVATEISKGSEKKEHRAMGTVIGMRSFSYLFAPAIAGMLAEPLTQYPEWKIDGWCRSALEVYPFILPNLVASILCLISALVVALHLPETLPFNQLRSPSKIPIDALNAVVGFVGSCLRTVQARLSFCWQPSASESERNFLLPTMASKTDQSTKETQPSIWSRRVTRQHLFVHWMYAFVSMATDEIFPLFCMSKVGGLGLTEASIGTVLSCAGIIFAAGQYVTLSMILDRFGVYKSLVIGSFIGVQAFTLIPTSLLLQSEPGQVGISMTTWLSLLIGIGKVFTSVYFISLAIALNKTVPTSQRGTMNGIAVFGGSLARGLGPVFAGWLSTVAYSDVMFPAQYGSILVYSSTCFFGILVTWRVMGLKSESE